MPHPRRHSGRRVDVCRCAVVCRCEDESDHYTWVARRCGRQFSRGFRRWGGELCLRDSRLRRLDARHRGYYGYRGARVVRHRRGACDARRRSCVGGCCADEARRHVVALDHETRLLVAVARCR